MVNDRRIVEPDGLWAASRVEYLLVLRAHWWAGWSLNEVLHLLEDDPQVSAISSGGLS